MRRTHRLAQLLNWHQFASIILTICLLASSTPAAPQTIVAITQQSALSFYFWFNNSGLRKLVQGERTPTARKQEKQSDRDVRVHRIQIYPGDVTVPPDQPIHVAAVAYDKDDAPVGGVKFTWRAHDLGSNRAIRISIRGEFQSARPGVYKITAEGANRRADVSVTVLDGPRRPKRDDNPANMRHVSNADLPQTRAKVIGPKGRDKAEQAGSGPSKSVEKTRVAEKAERFAHGGGLRAPEPMPVAPDDGWNGGNYWSSHDPADGVGDPPGHSIDGGAGSGNFQFAAPIYSSAGRGINLSLGAAYNARLWNKAGSQMNYDIDRGWPAPGWSLGFGKIMWMGSGGAMMVDADGTRHNYGGTVIYYNDSTQSTYFTLHTTDGSFIDYSGQFFIYYGTHYGSATATLANGTVINYFAVGSGAIYPTSILDPNGNYTTITYVNAAGPRIQTITDTLGRVVQFYYDSNNLLTAITAAGYNSSVARTLVRFHYRQISLASSSYSFPGLTTVVRDSAPWVIDAIYYPATNTGYWFGDSANTGYQFGATDSYSTYGMLAKVVEVRNMTFSGPDPVPPAQGPTGQGTITSAGQMTRKELYNYPLYVGDTSGTQSSNLTDAPTYTSLTESWTRDGTSTMDQAVTTYSVNENASPRTVEITLPNGTNSKQYSYNHAGQFDDGLVYLDETRDSNGTLLQSSTSSWAQGAYDSPRPTRVEKTDERGQTTAAEFSYGSVYNQVTEVRDYDYGGASLLRATRTTYQNSLSYTNPNRHIFNLPLSVEIYDGGNNRLTHTEYQYDGQTLTDTPGVVMHADSFNPHAPPYWVEGYWDWRCRDDGRECDWVWIDGYWVNVYDPSTDYRGNVTQVTSYADAYNLAGAVTETRRYDITGNIATASTSCCEQTSFNYTLNTQYAYPESKTRGSASDPYAQVTTTATYDFNTGLGKTSTDANGRMSTTNCYPDTLRPANSNSPTGAYTDYVYNDVDMTIIATTHAAPSAGGGIADQNLKYLNGRGQVRHEQALSPNSSWDHVDSIYEMGQLLQQTRPYHSGESPQFSTTEYDALGRVKTVTAPDGSVTRSFYNESTRPDVASSSPGETTRVQDAWGRERWGRTDSSGRLVEVVEPNPNGNGSVATGGLVTTYAYNTLGNLTTINSLTNGQVEQTRSFAYDSLGRLMAQKLAEMSATLDANGVYQAGGGIWSDVFSYDERSNLIARVDARGVKTIYSYFIDNNPSRPDPLNRLQSVSWDISHVGDTSSPVLPAATVTYQYRTKANPSDSTDVTQVASITTANVSTESYGFDGEGRVSSKTLTLANRQSFPFQTDYIYDTLDRITDVRYPAEYGNGSQARKLVHRDYDIASRITALSFDGQTFASNIAYNAASQTTSLTVGSGTNAVNETYNYNPTTGLLDSQTLVRNGATLLSLSYDYTNASGKRTGQLTKIYNNLDHGKDRSYSYDALGRLVQATGGPSGSFWTETYGYDRYGNRTSVSASGHTAKLEKPAEPKPNLPTDLIAKNSKIELPVWLREKDNEPISDTNTPLYRPAENTMPPRKSEAVMPLMPQSGSKIAFASTREGNSQIYTMNTDGSGQTRITNSQTNDEAPRWSSNSRIVFQSDRNNPFCDLYDIYTMNSDGSGQTRLTSDPNDDRAPVWSPDGNKIAFQSFRNGTNYQIYVMNADGSSQTNVSNSGANDTQPSWSPDGMKIAFASDRDHSGYPSVYVMNNNGANQTRLTFDATPYSDNQPSWSPDGSKIAFTSTRDSVMETWTDTDDYEIPDDDGQTFPRSLLHVNKEIYVMLSSGSGQTRLTNTLENDESPAWSANGSQIVFRSDRERDNFDPVPQVWVMNSDGSGQADLSNNNGGDYSPNCQFGSGGGGPTSVPNDGVPSLTFDNSSNRITTSGFAYDVAGNEVRAMIAGGGGYQRFRYDAANRMVQVLADNNSTVLASYTYGSSHERLISDEGGNRTYFDCVGGSTIAEYSEPDSSSTLTWSKSYVYLGARLLSTLTPSGGGGDAVEFDHPDRLGTRIVTNPTTGNFFEQQTLPFGTALNETPPAGATFGATNKQFTTYDRSGTTGLDYAYNRHYDSQQGRFTQVDPAGMAATNQLDPQSLNLYAYCGNDPINRTDSDGLGLISALKRAFKRIIKAFIHAVIVGVIAFVTSGFNIGAALAMFVADFAAELHWQSHGYWHNQSGTPPIFSTGGVTLSQIFQGTILEHFFAGPSSYLRFVIGFAGGSLVDQLGYDLSDAMKAINKCSEKLFGVTLSEFTPSTHGHSGMFTGIGTVLGDNFKSSITVVNDVTGYRRSGLNRLMRRFGGKESSSLQGLFVASHDRDTGKETGFSDYRNYTASNLRGSPFIFLIVQVHELGNSLAAITGRYHSEPDIYDQDADTGHVLEKCFRQEYLGQYP